jgi:hypothetical protein
MADLLPGRGARPDVEVRLHLLAVADVLRLAVVSIS